MNASAGEWAFVRTAIRAVRGSALTTLAGLAAAVVPFAIAVHIVAEAIATGDAVSSAFLVRHAYLLAPLIAALVIFCRTIGVGFPNREMIRRCAIARSHLQRPRPGQLVGYALANFTFFAATQLIEGVPIASGSCLVGLIAAATGSVLCAFVIVLWARSGATAVLDLIIHVRPHGPRVRSVQRTRFALPRSAWYAIALFAPNRPPPSPSLI